MAALSFMLLAPPWVAAQQKQRIQLAQRWIILPPQVAATHLIKKVTPIYPAFAKAAGIQGVVRVGVVISPDGHVDSIGPNLTGWACLWKAAMTAAAKYAYRPFLEDGRPVAVRTSEDIAFELPGQHSVFRPAPPPKVTFESFVNSPEHAFLTATPVADGPPEIRKWLLSQMQKGSMYSLWAKQGAFKGMKNGLPAKMVEIPTGAPASRVYMIIDNVPSPGTGYSLCGNGGCDIWWVVDDAGRVRDGFRGAGWGFYVRRRKGSRYPDIFTVSSTGMEETDVFGYANIAGHWGLLYCGTLQHGIHICR